MLNLVEYAQEHCMSSDRADNMWIENLMDEYNAIIKGYKHVNTYLDELLSLREKYHNRKFLKELDKKIDKEFKKLLTENKKVVY